MYRQNFLNRESFVQAGEMTIRESLGALPTFAPHIRFISENAAIESLRFSFAQPRLPLHYLIDVTIRKLDEQFMRVCLHATYADGRVIEDERQLALVLADFESALQAAIKGDTALYQCCFDVQETKHKVFSNNPLQAALQWLLLKKKLS